jgi:hypothetical protein
MIKGRPDRGNPNLPVSVDFIGPIRRATSAQPNDRILTPRLRELCVVAAKIFRHSNYPFSTPRFCANFGILFSGFCLLFRGVKNR